MRVFSSDPRHWSFWLRVVVLSLSLAGVLLTIRSLRSKGLQQSSEVQAILNPMSIPRPAKLIIERTGVEKIDSEKKSSTKDR